MKKKHLNSIILLTSVSLFFSIFFSTNIKADSEKKLQKQVVQEEKPQNNNNENTQESSIVSEAIKNGLKDAKEYTNKKYNELINKTNNDIRELEIKNKEQIDQLFDDLQNKSNTQFTKLDENIKETEKQANAGIAAAVSIASIPYCSNKNYSFGIGIGNYKNGNAIAAGIEGKINNNINAKINVAWSTNNQFSVGTGLAIGW